MPKKDKNQKQRKRRNKNRQRNGVPYYGPWWVGITYPSAVYDHEHFYSGGGTTEQSNPDGGGDSGGGVSAKLGSLEEEIINHNIQTSPPDVDHRFIIYQGQGFFWVEKQYLHRDLVFQGIAKDQGIDIKDVFTDPTFISGYLNKDKFNGDFLYVYEEQEPLPVDQLMILKEFYPDTPFYTVSWDTFYPMPGFPDFEEDHGVMASIRESVLQEGLEHMGYLGCFYCKRSIEEIRTLVTSKFMDTDYLVPSCPDCRR